MATLFLQLVLPLMVGAEVASAVVVPVSAIHVILPVAIRADLFDPVPPDAGRQLPVGDFDPWTVVMPGTMPAVAIVQVIKIRGEDDVIGGVHSDVKTESGGGDK